MSEYDIPARFFSQSIMEISQAKSGSESSTDQGDARVFFKDYPELVDSLVLSIAEGFVADGRIRADLPSDDFRRHVVRELKRVRRGAVEAALVIDHTDDILVRARSFGRTRQYELAFLFYVLWFEHLINGIIH